MCFCFWFLAIIKNLKNLTSKLNTNNYATKYGKNSKFSQKNCVIDAFEKLIANARYEHIFVSYNNEGIMSFSDIQSVMEKYGK